MAVSLAVGISMIQQELQHARVHQHSYIKHLVVECTQWRFFKLKFELIFACTAGWWPCIPLAPTHCIPGVPSSATSAPGIGEEGRLHRPPFLLCEALTLIMPSEKLVRT